MTTGVKERPILMATESVKAILESRKTQTRRVIKPQPDLLYSVYGGIIQVIHNDLDWEGNNGELSIKANTNITKRQLYGGERWEDIFKNKIQRLREEGFSGLVSISRTRHGAEGIFSGLLVPQQYQNNAISTPPSVYGFPRDASQEVNASEASGRKLPQQQTRQFEVGNAIRELDGQTDAQSAEPPLQQSKLKDILKGKRIYPLGDKQGHSKQKAYSQSIRDEPTIHIRNLPWFVGQRLWVRETHAFPAPTYREPVYKAGYEKSMGEQFFGIPFPWRPSIFMPRWASRITLEITEVRAERLQKITKADCKAEGIFALIADYLAIYELSPALTYISKFAELWDSLNAKRGYGWSLNPWVWVISFRRIECQT